MSRRLEPTVFLATISPITVGLVVGTIALVRVTTGSWIAAVLAGIAIWIARIALSIWVARRIRGLDARIDPFALREPWRFFVRNALTAQKRFAEAVAQADDGPLRERLIEIELQMKYTVSVTWEMAQRGQQLTDARRRIDLTTLERTIEAAPDTDPRHRAAVAQRDSHRRLSAREDQARSRLEVLDAQLDETVVRAAELATRTGDQLEIEALAEQVDGMVDELDSLRLALDELGDGA